MSWIWNRMILVAREPPTGAALQDPAARLGHRWNSDEVFFKILGLDGCHRGGHIAGADNRIRHVCPIILQLWILHAFTISAS